MNALNSNMLFYKYIMSPALPAPSYLGTRDMLSSALIRPSNFFALTALLVSAKVMLFIFRNSFRSFMTTILDRLGSSYHLRYDHIRNVFIDTPGINNKPARNHTHPTSAAARSDGSATINQVIKRLGLMPYSFQMSASDARKGTLGSRVWYWVKDLTVKPAIFKPPADSCVFMIDTDHYVDMPRYLTQNFAPLFLRTLQPSRVASINNEYSYKFDENNVIDYKVSGGGSYKHQIWNYQQDHVWCFTWSLFTPIPVWTSYLIERRANSTDHDLVCFVPLKKYTGLLALVARVFLSGNKLARYVVNHGTFNILDVRTPDGHTISIGTPNEYVSANVDRTSFEAALGVARALKNEVTMPSIETLLPEMDKSSLKVTSALITNLVRTKVGPKPMFVFPVKDAVRRYQFGTFDPEARPSLVPFMSPLIHSAYAPDESLDNELRAIQARITDLKKQVETPPTAFELQIMDEFAELLIPIKHQGSPEDHDYLMEQQDKPTQRRLVDMAAAMLSTSKSFVQSFLKREASATPSDPRVISIVQPRVKYDYSLFIYGFSHAVMSNQQWYAFSRTPVQVANKVTSIAEQSATMAVTDYSRFDGHKDSKARELERRVMLRFFRPCYHNELMEIHNRTYNLVGYGRYGSKYETGFAQNSGDPATSTFNTMLNAFLAYFALRRTNTPLGWLGPEAAWKHLETKCLFGGDDGVIGDPPTTLSDTAKLLGHVLTIDTVNRGDFGVSFLSRQFGPNVWFGDNNSTCDIFRQVSKLHVTPSLPSNVTPVEKLAQKCHSFNLTDANTPILGAFVSVVVMNLKPTGIIYLSRWGDGHDKEVQWPNEPREWYWDILMKDPRWSTLDVDRFTTWLKSLLRNFDTTIALSPPIICEIVNEPHKNQTVHYQEETIKPTSTKSTVTITTNNTTKSTRQKQPLTKVDHILKRQQRTKTETSQTSSPKPPSVTTNELGFDKTKQKVVVDLVPKVQTGPLGKN
jgi:hypothetical protein